MMRRVLRMAFLEGTDCVSAGAEGERKGDSLFRVFRRGGNDARRPYGVHDGLVDAGVAGRTGDATVPDGSVGPHVELYHSCP